MQARGYPPESNAHGSGDEGKHKMADASFDENMSFWHERLPKGNKCLTSFEEAKKIMCPLDLPHVKYHVCICPVCGVTRYKKRKKAPRKVVWYFPITPGLHYYYRFIFLICMWYRFMFVTCMWYYNWIHKHIWGFACEFKCAWILWMLNHVISVLDPIGRAACRSRTVLKFKTRSRSLAHR